uniref:Talin N-terminal F0 domain-containing protein n=1 Tax=Sinocyclocheilus rhinocerous TaxID=307959 RepID=A0A673N7M2_9TELE
MPRSPASSEDEMAQSVSDHSQGSSSESFKEEAIYETIRTEQTVSCMTDVQSHSLVIRCVSSHDSVLLSLSQKVVRFDPSASVWAARQRLLCTLSQNLKDVLNYGLFQPATDDRNARETLQNAGPRPGPQLP